MSRWSSIRSRSNARTSCIEPGVATTGTVSVRPSARSSFWVVLLVLVAASIYLSIVIWRQIERTFGL